MLTQKAAAIELNRKNRYLEEELKKLKIAYTNMKDDKEKFEKLAEAEKLAKGSAERKAL